MSHIAISWSRWSDFDQCPRKFYLKYIEKAENFQEKGEKSVHLVRGEQLHKQLEKYTLHKIDPESYPMPAMSPETMEATKLIDQLIASSTVVLPETQLAINKGWQKVEWFDKEAAMRAILDLIALRQQPGQAQHAVIWDWKTGKYQPYADECGQLHLSAAMIILLKDLEYADVAYVFLDSKKSAGIRVTAEQAEKIVQPRFNERFERVNSEVQWNPKPNEFCGWCNATAKQCPKSRKL